MYFRIFLYTIFKQTPLPQLLFYPRIYFFTFLSGAWGLSL